GNFDHAEITRELEEAHAKGMGGFDIWDVTYVQDEHKVVPAGPPFMGPESTRAIAHAIREAGRIGMDIGLIISSGWNAGGDWVRPEHRTMGLFRSTRTVEGPGAHSLDLPFPDLDPPTSGRRRPLILARGADGLPVFHRDVALLATPAGAQAIGPRDVVDLTGQTSWNAPAGRWTITRYVCTNTGQPLISNSDNSAGPMIDHFNPEATEAHLEHFIRLLTAELGPLSKTALRYLYTDSYEVQGNLWTPRLAQEFSTRFGYSILPFLPALDGRIVGSPQTTSRFQADYARLLSDLIIEAHYQKGAEVCHRHGIRFAAEAAGPGAPIHNCPFESLRSSGALDVLRGEFWHKYSNPNHPPDTVQVVKGVASAAHIYNKKFVEAEAFTSVYLWQEGPAELKPDADRAFCEGLNRIVYHTFPHAPRAAGRPGNTYGFGTQISEELPWWPLSAPWHDYLARVSYLLQQGVFVADVLYYYGDLAPNFVPAKSIPPGLGPGYDYDVVNADILLHKLEARNGRIVLPHGPSYELLVLPDEETMRPEILARIGRLLDAGALILGKVKPLRAPGLSRPEIRDSEVRRLADRFWPRVVSNRTPLEVLQSRRIAPDLEFPAGAPIDWIHRRDGSRDIYFVRNTSAQPLRASLRLRSPARASWNPVTLEVLPVDRPAEVSLPPYGSLFLVSGATPPSRDTRGAAGSSLPVNGPWRVDFAGARTATFQSLSSWSAAGDEEIRFFSGVAKYETEFTYQPSSKSARTYIDLGQVELLARVSLNGQEAGSAWTPPFEVEVTDLLRPGANKLTVEVANSWPNALVGDARRPRPDRRYRTNITKLPTGWSMPFESLPNDKYPLRTSGLLGPVRLIQR
ncbi:MAG TPA: hypothetical protein DEH78_09390, partial [Solibacterales bacterium]|nr:hypothetical protein [Bryobacterales bacterium]